MSYDIAINKAWDELAGLKPGNKLEVKFLADDYDIDLVDRKVFSAACNVPAKDFYAILILHYLVKQLKGLPGLTGEWMPFRELSGIEGYYSAFKQRSIEPIIRKYGNNPEAALSVLERLPGKRVEGGDIGIALEAFSGVPVLIKLWRKDEEFAPDANIFFDRSITQIFCTEDIVVLAGIVAANI